MIKKSMKLTASSIFWILIASLTALFFLGILWISNGVWMGIPAFLAVSIMIYFIIKYLYGRYTSNLITKRGFIFRAIPVLMVFILISWSMIPMAPVTLAELPDTDAIQYWDLGSERVVAVMHHPPADTNRLNEHVMLFVHGGPGAYIRDFDRDFFAGFTQDGYHVYLYEQIGAGRSAILGIQEYSHEANVNDLARVIERIEQPLILIGQSYGAALISSYLYQYPDEHQIEAVILTEPGPLPGMYPQQGPYYDEKTTLAENNEGPGFFEMVRSPRFPISLILQPENRFVSQVELMNYMIPELHQKIVATSYCKDDQSPKPDFTKLRLNMKAGQAIRASFMKAETPELKDLDLPVLLLLGECSYLPRGYAIDYFDSFKISRSHWIPGVGHIIWGNRQGSELTRTAILSFLNDTEIELPNEPDIHTRFKFVESGK